MGATLEVADPMKIIAVVEFNKGEAFVLNRAPKFLYERQGNDLIATDGPFTAVYRYELPCGRFKAFAGREFDIPMLDGSTIKASGQYWASGLEGHLEVTWSIEERLRDCYVFFGGAMAKPDELAALRSEYNGCVYPYWDYEKVLKFDEMRMKGYRRQRELERALSHVKRNAKCLKAQLRAAQAAAL